MIFGRRKKYSIPRQAAGDTLKNVFAACNIETENINFDLLILKSIAQTTLVDACKWITIGFLFFTLVSPVALINNDMKIESRGIASERIMIRDHQLYKDHFIYRNALLKRKSYSYRDCVSRRVKHYQNSGKRYKAHIRMKDGSKIIVDERIINEGFGAAIGFGRLPTV